MPVERSSALDTILRIERLRIRNECAADAENIGRVTAEAFAPMPFGDGTEAGLIEALRAAGALTVSLVAILDEEFVGHISFSPVTINDRPSTWYQLSPVSVAPLTQGRGIGSALIISGLDRLRDLRAGGCVLTGNSDYYRRFGFESDPVLTYKGKPNRYLQRLVLDGVPVAGDVGFHPAFGE
jgi:putative acetyltransferase